MVKGPRRRRFRPLLRCISKSLVEWTAQRSSASGQPVTRVIVDHLRYVVEGATLVGEISREHLMINGYDGAAHTSSDATDGGGDGFEEQAGAAASPADAASLASAASASAS